MTVIQIFGLLRAFGMDVLLIALGVTFLTSLLKKTLFKSFSGKVYVFLPFALGIVLYAIWRMLSAWSISPLTEDILSTFEGGFACGSCATLYYCIYEQFLRGGRSKASPLEPLLQGFVPEEKLSALSDALMSGYKDVEKDALEGFVKETMRAVVPELQEDDIALIAPLVAKFLGGL